MKKSNHLLVARLSMDKGEHRTFTSDFLTIQVGFIYVHDVDDKNDLHHVWDYDLNRYQEGLTKLEFQASVHKENLVFETQEDIENIFNKSCGLDWVMCDTDPKFHEVEKFMYSAKKIQNKYSKFLDERNIFNKNFLDSLNNLFNVMGVDVIQFQSYCRSTYKPEFTCYQLHELKDLLIKGMQFYS